MDLKKNNILTSLKSRRVVKRRGDKSSLNPPSGIRTNRCYAAIYFVKHKFFNAFYF